MGKHSAWALTGAVYGLGHAFAHQTGPEMYVFLPLVGAAVCWVMSLLGQTATSEERQAKREARRLAKAARKAAREVR